MDQVQSRIETLEKERFLHRLLVVLGVFAGLLGVAIGVVRGGAKSGAIIRASEFHLVDSGGNSRARLTFDQNGQPVLEFRSTDNKLRETIGLYGDDNDPRIQLLDRSEKQRIALSINRDGLPVLEFFSPEGIRRNTLGLEPLGNPRIELFNPSGGAGLTITSAGTDVKLSDANGNVLSTNAASITLQDAAKKTVFQAP